MRLTAQRAWQRWKTRRLKLCFAIAASANDGFYGQIAMFRRSLDYLGGIYKRAAVIATFGDQTIRELPDRWQPHFDRIITHFVPPASSQGPDDHFAQSFAKWTNIPDECDFVVFSDADTIVLRPLDNLLNLLVAAPSVAGTIAHWTPFHFEDVDPREEWAALARECLGREIPLDYTHTFTTDKDPPSLRKCPFYLNFGCVIVPRKLLDPIRSTYLPLLSRVLPLLRNPSFTAQVSLTLAVYAHRTPHQAVDMRYNFPNDELAEALYAESLQDVRVIHYLRTQRFDRQQIFASAEGFDSFLKLNLRGSNKVFQDHVRILTDSRYPF